MADDDTEPTPAGPSTAELAQRLDEQGGKLDHLAEMVAKLVPGSRKEAQEHTERHLDRPTTVEEQVKAELERRDKLAAEQKAQADADAERKSVAERLAKLEERPPAEPRSKLKRIGTGWG